ncbi:MAG: sodium-translocating pyrophosphatase [Candidatus Altiarchaeota archaeon]
MIYAIVFIGFLGVLFAAYKALWLTRISIESPKVAEITEAIHKGALTFLNSEYRVLVWFVLAVALFLGYFLSPVVGVTFVVGAFCSALTGNIGMRIATVSNGRTAEASEHSINKGLLVAFTSGSVSGFIVVAIGLLGVSVFYLLLGDPDLIVGFGFGASSIALFARVGGGIYTKSADVGADLVGKVEAGIPEDDPRNPAVIADNVGDNVGDVAGMEADLFESYVNSIIAAMVIGVISFGKPGVLLPMAIAAVGVVSSMIGSFFVRIKEGGDIHNALNKGTFAAAILVAVISYFTVSSVMGAENIGIYYAVLAGLIAGMVIGLTAEYYTSDKYKPTRDVAETSETGSATVLISGMSVGMLSTMIPILVVAAALLVAEKYAGLYGIAIAAVGMLATLGITLSTDTYGPVADNAAGIAEMAGMGKEVRRRCEELDAVGNTTAAIGKGFAIGSAALTSLALFSAYVAATKIDVIDITDSTVMAGLLIGGMLPFLFSSFTMKSVGKAAYSMVEEVRRQFKEIPGLMEGKAKPDYERCIEISTKAAIREMILPGLIAILTPLAVGVWLGPQALGGLLGGAIVTGFLLAIMMANSGAVWDNAKKYIEAGHLGGKGSSTHKAAVVGDTVGDPFKDTSGPSLNILIKLISIVSLVFAPLFI